MKITASKVEEMEVELSDEAVIDVMCILLKQDYFEFKEDKETKDVTDAIAIVYEAYTGKPIDLVERFSH